MRQVGTLATQQDAERFADYLVTLGIPSRVDPAPNGFGVWVIEENDVARAKQTLSEFQANPTDPRYAAAHATAEELRQRQAAERRKAQRKIVDLSQRWNGPLRRRIPLTMLLIGSVGRRDVAQRFQSPTGNRALVDPFQLGHESHRALAWATVAALDADAVARQPAPLDLQYVLALRPRFGHRDPHGDESFGGARARDPIGCHVWASFRRPAGLRRDSPVPFTDCLAMSG